MNGTENKLTVTTPSDLEVVMTRAFNAPRELVFETFSKAEHLRRWWGGVMVENMTVCEIDFRVGGTWRIAFVLSDAEYGFNGAYKEIVRPGRIVQTQIYEPVPHDVVTVTLEFEERNGQTWMVETLTLDSKEARDAMLQTGMEDGAANSLDTLEELLAELQEA